MKRALLQTRRGIYRETRQVVMILQHTQKYIETHAAPSTYLKGNICNKDRVMLPKYIRRQEEKEMAILESISNAAKASSKNEKGYDYHIFGELWAQKVRK